MLCCLLAALGLAGAWTALRLRLAGALILLIAGGGMAGYLLWDHIGHAGRYLAQGAGDGGGTGAIAICSGRRSASIRDYPIY